MKLYYFNDTKQNQHIYLETFHSIPIMLEPGKGDTFTVHLKDNYIPFIKVWESGNVLISTMYFKE